VPKHPQTEPENLSVAPIDTMLVGMEKSFSGHSNYERIGDPHLRAEREIAQWPGSLNPGTSPLDFHQAPNLLPTDGNLLTGQHRSQNTFNFESQQEKGLLQFHAFTEPINSARIAGEKQRPVISTAPQTKVQQQRKRSKKYSQSDLEQLVLRLLEQPDDVQNSAVTSTQADRSSKLFLTGREARMIADVIRQSPGSAFSQPRKSSGLGFNTNTKVCDKCGYTVARACDMKKHMKRHDKPYGCTYPKCHKRFGAKSDWKRHENSQHFQLEAYRCSQLSPAGKACGEHFLRIDHFKKHLDTQHKLSDEQQQVDEAKRRKIGKNCQQQFWCGFHGEIIELKEKRNAAWDERFDHIAKHFEKDKKSIEEWVCAEENKTKKELLKEMDRYVFDDEDERGENGIVLGGNGPPPSVLMNVPLPPPPLHDHATSLQQVHVSDQSDNRKRRSSTDLEDIRGHSNGPKPAVSIECCVSGKNCKYVFIIKLTLLVFKWLCVWFL
jgi:hypothetical protein